MNAVRVDKVGDTRGATNARDTDDFFMRNAELLYDIEKGGEHGEITATRTPGRVVGFELFFRKGCALWWGGHDRLDCEQWYGIVVSCVVLLCCEQLFGGFGYLADAEREALDFIERPNGRVAGFGA